MYTNQYSAKIILDDAVLALVYEFRFYFGTDRMKKKVGFFLIIKRNKNGTKVRQFGPLNQAKKK